MIYVDTNILISYINNRDPLHVKAINTINKYNNAELIASIITQIELYSVYSRVMNISDIELDALVLYTLEKTRVSIKELDLNELFTNAIKYANKLKLKTLDLLHITAAYMLDCDSFITFDKDILARAKIIEENLGIKINN